MMKKKVRESGQATIEFVLVMVFLLGFVFFFVQLSLVFGWSNYLQYATYYSARTLVASRETPGEQKAAAQEVLELMVHKGGGPRLPFVARDDKGLSVGESTSEGFSKTDRSSSWLEGARYSFKSKVFILPVGKGELPGDEKYLHLTSETWLGREPSDSECRSEMATGASKSGARTWEIDNGC